MQVLIFLRTDDHTYWGLGEKDEFYCATNDGNRQLFVLPPEVWQRNGGCAPSRADSNLRERTGEAWSDPEAQLTVYYHGDDKDLADGLHPETHHLELIEYGSSQLSSSGKVNEALHALAQAVKECPRDAECSEWPTSFNGPFDVLIDRSLEHALISLHVLLESAGSSDVEDVWSAAQKRFGGLKSPLDDKIKDLLSDVPGADVDTTRIVKLRNSILATVRSSLLPPNTQRDVN